MHRDALRPLSLTHIEASAETLRDMSEFMRQFGMVGLETLFQGFENEEGSSEI